MLHILYTCLRLADTLVISNTNLMFATRRRLLNYNLFLVLIIITIRNFGNGKQYGPSVVLHSHFYCSHFTFLLREKALLCIYLRLKSCETPRFL